MTPKEALEKIDHLICMNANEGTLKWDVDTFDHCACINIDDFCNCYDTIYHALEKLEELEAVAIKK